MTTLNDIKLGDALTCAYTGEAFTAERRGISTNYARLSSGEVMTLDGAYYRQCEEIANGSTVEGVYISGNDVVTWTGYVLGRVYSSHTTPHNMAREMRHVKVRMFDGSDWYGKYSHENMQCCTLRRSKGSDVGAYDSLTKLKNMRVKELDAKHTKLGTPNIAAIISADAIVRRLETKIMEAAQ